MFFFDTSCEVIRILDFNLSTSARSCLIRICLISFILSSRLHCMRPAKRYNPDELVKKGGIDNHPDLYWMAWKISRCTWTNGLKYTIAFRKGLFLFSNWWDSVCICGTREMISNVYFDAFFVLWLLSLRRFQWKWLKVYAHCKLKEKKFKRALDVSYRTTFRIR